MKYRFPGLIFCFATLCKGMICAQDLKPGLSGMAPSRWITFRHVMAPGTEYRSATSQPKTYTREELYVRAWIPVVHKSNFAIVLGPHYRTEQLELKTKGENPVSQFANWKLRTMGVDMKSLVKLDSTSWLIFASNVNKSGNLSEMPYSKVPFNYAFTAVFLKKKSLNKEIGAGLLVSKSNRLNILPVFVFNYNFSPKLGVEITLPHKIAWRYNLTPTDIFYFKNEAVTRTYYTYGLNDQPSIFRRIDLDMSGVYNKQISKLVGFELSAGYRRNISNRLPEHIIPIKSSGFVAGLEIYIRSPFGMKKDTE